MAGQDEVEVHEQHQCEHGADRVQDVPDVGRALAVSPRPGPPGQHPPGRGDDHRARRGARECPGGRAGDREAHQGAAHPDDRVGQQQHGHGPEPVRALEEAVAEAGDRDAGQCEREQDRGGGRTQVQQWHEQWHGEQRGRGDGTRGEQAEGDHLPLGVLVVLLGGPPRHPQRDYGLQPHGGH